MTHESICELCQRPVLARDEEGAPLYYSHDECNELGIGVCLHKDCVDPFGSIVKQFSSPWWREHPDDRTRAIRKEVDGWSRVPPKIGDVTNGVEGTACSGLTFAVAVVFKGDSYGLHGCKTHDQAMPLIEFYDPRYPHTIHGQFVSRYNLDSLLGYCNWSRPHDQGLDMDGGVASWKLDATARREACQLALKAVAQRTAKVRQGPEQCCVWDDCDADALYCEGHAIEMADFRDGVRNSPSELRERIAELEAELREARGAQS